MMLHPRLVCWKLVFGMFCGAALSGCGGNSAIVAPPPAASAPASPAVSPDPHHHHHELNLPPVGPQVSVVFQDRRVEITLSELAHGAATIPLMDLWKAAQPDRDPTLLNFDLFGSDGFHPSARPPCVRPLTAQMIAAAHIDVLSHDISYDPGHDLPGCYRVHAVVRFEGRAATP